LHCIKMKRPTSRLLAAANKSRISSKFWLRNVESWNKPVLDPGHGSTILVGSGRVGSGRVTGQCDRPGVWSSFGSFCTRFIGILPDFGERIRHLGIYWILCILCIFRSSCLLAQILVICYSLQLCWKFSCSDCVLQSA